MARRIQLISGLLAATLILPGGGSGHLLPRQDPANSLNPVSWFRRADDFFNVRMPGSAPFVMRVTFTARPGIAFSKKEKLTVAAGDGVYTETWLSPEKWRREVTFGSYHAIEVRADGVRKFQASSDYEPSRVLMLLDALLNPIPRNLVSPELIDGTAEWKVASLMTSGGMPWVRINSNSPWGEFAFLPDGILVRSEAEGITTSWESDVVFSGKAVPRHLTVQAGNRKLVAADIAINPVQVAPDLSQLEGGPADPGMTLRPLHWYEVRGGYLLNPSFATAGPPIQGAVRAVLDQRGTIREAEVIYSSDIGVAEAFVDMVRSREFRPARIDGYPCEIIIVFNGV